MIQSQISQDQSIELLGRLAQDSSFRQTFRVDPRAALRSLGVDIGDMGPVSVPSMEDAELMRNDLTARRERQRPSDFCGVPMPMWPVFTAAMPKVRVN